MVPSGAMPHRRRLAMEQLAWLWVIKNSNVKDNLMDRDREWVSRMLGEAVIDVWSGLPQDIQQKLFEQAVLTAGSADEEDLRGAPRQVSSRSPSADRTSSRVATVAVPARF